MIIGNLTVSGFLNVTGYSSIFSGSLVGGETALGYDNVRAGTYIGTPRIIFEDGNRLWEIDHIFAGGVSSLRIFTPLVSQVTFTDGHTIFNGNITVNNNISAENFFGNVTGAIVNTNAPVQCPSNTGMVYYNGSDSICTQAIGYWNNSGASLYPSLSSFNVGIGTTTPSNKLVVDGNFSITDGDYLVPNNECAFKSSADPDICLLFRATAPSAFAFLDGNADAVLSIVLGTRTVGINKINPSARLDVNGTVRMGDGGSNYAGIDIDGDLSFAGTADYLVNTNKAAFKATADEDAGLFFLSPPARYGFTSLTGIEIFTINAGTGNVGIRTTTPDKTLQVVGTTKTGQDTENFTHFESDGTLVMNGSATVWEDLQVPISTVRLPASNMPTWTDYKGGQVLSFSSSQSNIIYFTAQMPHSMKKGSLFDLHIHYVTPNANAGNVLWNYTYSMADIGSVFPTETYGGVVGATPESTDNHTLLQITELTSGDIVSGLVLFKLQRTGADALDTYGSDIYLVAVDLHYESDTLGSRKEAEK